MLSTFGLIFVLNIFSFVSSLFLSVYAYKNKADRTSFLFFILMAIFTFWGVSNSVLMYIDSLRIQIIFSHIIRSVTTFTPMLILFIVISYTGNPRWFGQRFFNIFFEFTFLLIIVSILDIFFDFLTIDLKLEYIYNIPTLIISPQPYFFIYLIHIYLCLFFSIIILIYSLFNKTIYFRTQTIFILIGLAIPAINDFMFWFGYSLIKDYQLITISFAVGNLFLAYAILGYNFLKVKPIARKLVIDSIEDIMIITNQDDKIIDINRSCELFFNIENKKIIGNSFFKIFENYNSFVDLYKIKKNQELEIEINKLKYYFSAKINIIESNNQIISNIILLHDITQNRKIQEEVKEVSEKFKALFNNSNYGVAILNKESEYVMINPAYTKITGFESNDLLGKKVGGLIHLDNKEKINVFLKLFGTTEREICADEIKIVNKQGGAIWIYLVANNYINLNGEFEYATLEFNDITERKNAEIKLKKYATELEEINATKDKFFSIIAHDLRNPFNSLIGFSNLILENKNKYDLNKIISMVEIINNNSQTGYKLLENLLEWSHIQTSTIEFNPTSTKLKLIVNEATNLLILAAKKKNITIINSVDIDIEIFVDYNMIYTVLRNIISNSIKYTKQSGLVKIEAFINEIDNNLKICITDNGIGIDENLQSKIFNIDNKITKLGTDNEKGSGLGLILCKEFVEKNGGKIWIESKINEGTKVFFSLPLCNFNFENFNKKLEQNIKDEKDETIKKYQLPNYQTQKIIEQLIYLLEIEKIFTDTNLNLNDLAAKLNINRVYLSQIINDTFNNNFNNLINEYRIKEAINLLQNNELNYKMEYIAILCGFNSKSTFYTAFKKITGVTPSEYLKKF